MIPFFFPVLFFFVPNKSRGTIAIHFILNTYKIKETESLENTAGSSIIVPFNLAA